MIFTRIESRDWLLSYLIITYGWCTWFSCSRWCTWHLTWTRRPTTWLPMSFFQTCRMKAWYLIQITKPFRYQNLSQNENNSCWLIFIITLWPNIRISLDNPYKSGWREEFYSLLDWIGAETVSIILCHQPLFYSEIFNHMVTKMFNAVGMLSVHLPLPFFSLVVRYFDGWRQVFRCSRKDRVWPLWTRPLENFLGFRSWPTSK